MILRGLANWWQHLAESSIAVTSSEVQLDRRSILPARGMQRPSSSQHGAAAGTSRTVLIPQRISAAKVEPRLVASSASAQASQWMRRKCIGRFLVLYQHIWDHAEIGFVNLDVADEQNVWEATQVVSACATRLSENHISSTTACLRKWI